MSSDEQVASLTEAERTAIVREIHGYAEGVEENLRDDAWDPDNPLPRDHVFPYVEDLLKAGDNLAEGRWDPDADDALEGLADSEAATMEPLVASALVKLGFEAGR